MQTTKTKIYTDGACLGNPGRGGWAAIIFHSNGEKQELSMGYLHTTNNRMELRACLGALEALRNPDLPIEIYTDSTYVQKGMTTWLPGWKAKGWRKADKKPILNLDLWQALDVLNSKHNITWHWVKGHAANPYNNRADELAVSAAHGSRLIADDAGEPAPTLFC